MLDRQGSEAEPGKGQGDSAVPIFLVLFFTVQMYFNWQLLTLFCPCW